MTQTVKLTVLAGEGYIVENAGNAFDFVMSMSRKGWLGRVSSVKGSGLYLEGTHRLAGFVAYCKSQGVEVRTAA